MMIVMTFLEKLVNFAYTNNTLIEQKPNYHAFFVL